mmetsp:Transcript_66825/g.136112  ORF Transcript_66825/g.136112 Transcript_66825/m.136112 type:complete len:154 (+) Transcript_66825:86-547(+)
MEMAFHNTMEDRCRMAGWDTDVETVSVFDTSITTPISSGEGLAGWHTDVETISVFDTSITSPISSGDGLVEGQFALSVARSRLGFARSLRLLVQHAAMSTTDETGPLSQGSTDATSSTARAVTEPTAPRSANPLYPRLVVIRRMRQGTAMEAN